ncbi:hypothetical protein GHK45_32085 [Sinorhizobium meliloti]|uniref:Uncharacterized protein n=1 Tax=Rhizobium meliloti TaxID=382 RepID=A0A6A7ZZ94_RHIML|nr:hypothetical protein [Sinorhizobium meliloti]MQW08206.1 hypothetical protein [Sinorhizobium meliloti]
MVRLLFEEARHAPPLPGDVQSRRNLQPLPSTSTADALPRSGFVLRPQSRFSSLALKGCEPTTRYIARALCKEVAAWALDEETLTELRLKGIKWVGVQVSNNGAIYITHVSNYLDYEMTRQLAVVNSLVQRRYLPLISLSFRDAVPRH